MKDAVLRFSDVLQWAIQAWQLILIVAVLLSWFHAPPEQAAVRFLRACTEPVLRGLRRRLPVLTDTGWDLTPLAAFFISNFFLWALVGGLRHWGARL